MPLFEENGIEVEIKNNSNQPISNVEFNTTENLNSIKFKNIQPNEKITDFFRMSENKSDGSYSLKFKRHNGKIERSGAGYYTNGGSLDSRVIFNIQNDTVYASTSQY